MKKITEVFQNKERTYSFELFPPKTEEGYQKLLHTIHELSNLKPDFISVTYGAGGGSRDKTFDIVQHIQERHGLIGVAHLTCVCHTKEEIKHILEQIKGRGIRNVLALRGDPPKDNPNWQPGNNNFKYSCELCAFIRQHFRDYFGIGVAGFPEGHILAPDRETDANHLKIKIDSGADYVITQLFFDNKDYFDYIERLRKRGVAARVIPGIIPITDYQSLIRFCQICGATITPEIHRIFDPIQNDKDATLKAGIEFAIRQCRELLNSGAPGLHFYTLNKLNPTDIILSEVQR
jgi:methylenetetrahydrofolate reductase (NADPH)